MWEQIRSNQMRSVVLVIAMGLVLLGLGYALGFYFFDTGIGGIAVALAVWLIMNLVTFFQGDNILLALHKARKIGPDDHPRLYNVVEEMKIASGLEKMPGVYIIDDQAMNAFAIGRNKDKAAVAVTAGLLAKLNRDELQGVIAHEMAHIKNRDVLLMTVCSVMLGTIVILSWYASRMMIFGGAGGRRGSGGGVGAQAIILIIALLLVILAPIFAQLIYFAVSRKREYLADASGAAYTRYPEGLASALEKISGSTEPLKSANQATAPMYIMNPFRKKSKPASNLTSTHPPVSERVRILRSMGGATFADYNAAYSKVHRGGGSVIPPSAMGAVPEGGTRTAQSKPKKPPRVEDTSSEIKRARETSDALWKLNNYKTINCKCGARLKTPPDFKGNRVKCPHCGNTNILP